eukprot:1753278-Pyramimonas_sp.AAC.1
MLVTRASWPDNAPAKPVEHIFSGCFFGWNDFEVWNRNANGRTRRAGRAGRPQEGWSPFAPVCLAEEWSLVVPPCAAHNSGHLLPLSATQKSGR